MNDPETDRLRPSKEELSLFLEKEFSQTKCRVVEVGNQTATIAHEIGEAELRPGGTVSAPVLMEVADVALYVALLGEIGIVPLSDHWPDNQILAQTTGYSADHCCVYVAQSWPDPCCRGGPTLLRRPQRTCCSCGWYLLDSTNPAFLEADFSSVGSSVPWPSSQEPVEFAHDSPSG